MSMDISFKRRAKILCPKCSEVAGYREIAEADSGGGVWYELLAQFGYYVPDSDDDWYGKDMTLTDDQAREAYKFAMRNNPYNYGEITALIAKALMEGDDIVINADW